MDKLLTGKEVSEMLRISRETLKSWRNSGKLPFVKISPKKFLYNSSDVEQILSGRKRSYKRDFLVSAGCTLQLSEVQPFDLEKLEIADIVFKKDSGDIVRKPLETESKFSISEGGTWTAKFPFNDSFFLVEATPDLIHLGITINDSKDVLVGCIIGERM